jgi:hypothetical protein
MRSPLHTDAGQDFLQWFGLLAAPLAWTVQLVLGFGVTQAACSTVRTRWGVSVDTWETSLMVASALIVVLAEVCAVTLYRATIDVPYDGPPPVGRRHFFVAASSLGNVLFLAIILMSGIAAVHHTPCQQS